MFFREQCVCITYIAEAAVVVVILGLSLKGFSRAFQGPFWDSAPRLVVLLNPIPAARQLLSALSASVR